MYSICWAGREKDPPFVLDCLEQILDGCKRYFLLNGSSDMFDHTCTLVLFETQR